MEAELVDRVAEGGHQSRFTVLQKIVMVAGAVFLAWIARELLLLLFTGVLGAVLLRGLSNPVAERTRLSEGWSLFVVVIGLLALATGAGLLLAPSLSEQVGQLADTLPQAARRLMETIRRTAVGGWVLEQVQFGQGEAAGQHQMVQRASSMAGKLVDSIVGLAIVIFTALYFAAAPRTYIRGFLRLLPRARRERFGQLIYASGYTLRWWLLGQLLAMTIVGILMSAGLAIIGVPLALALGILSGIFEFIPTIGPVFGLVPALLLALAEAPQMAVYVLVLYGIVQTIESYVLTPLVQERVIELPPVVTIATQVLFAWVLGPLGLLVAVPFVAVMVLAVQMLYVEDALGDRMEITAEREGKREMQASDVLP